MIGRLKVPKIPAPAELPHIPDHTVVQAGDTVIASHISLKQHIEPLLNALSELNEAIEPLHHGVYDAAIIIEMHPYAFRELMHTLHAHLSRDQLYQFRPEPGMFQLYNITFKAVPPGRDTRQRGNLEG